MIQSRGSIYCSQCGSGAGPDALFCSACGHRLDRTEGPMAITDDHDLDALRAAVGLIAGDRARDAISPLQELVERRPEWAIARAYLGTAYLRTGRVAEARDELETSVAISPDSFICTLRYAEFLATLGFYDKAVVQLVKAIDLEAPDDKSRYIATELLHFCRDSAKGIFYRPTAFPRLPRIGVRVPWLKSRLNPARRAGVVSEGQR